MFLRKTLASCFFSSSNICCPHTLCQLIEFTQTLLNFTVEYFANHFFYISLVLNLSANPIIFWKCTQITEKKLHCSCWPVVGPAVCPPTDHYDGTGAIPRLARARRCPDAHQPLQRDGCTVFNLHVHVVQLLHFARNVRTTLLTVSWSSDLAGPCLRGSPVPNCFLILKLAKRHLTALNFWLFWDQR